MKKKMRTGWFLGLEEKVDMREKQPEASGKMLTKPGHEKMLGRGCERGKEERGSKDTPWEPRDQEHQKAKRPCVQNGYIGITGWGKGSPVQSLGRRVWGRGW